MSGRTLLVLVLAAAGCAGSRGSDPAPATLAERAARRAFTGAPPVIPHPPLSGSCRSCHTPAGRPVPNLGMAPANPHALTPGLGEQARCRQCHVFRQSEGVFVQSEFVGWRNDGARGERAHAFAPPTIPHPTFLREDCRACHAGPAARPEILCRHADRLRCLQCHVAQLAAATWPDDLAAR